MVTVSDINVLSWLLLQRLLNPHIETFAKASENDTEMVEWISHLHISDIADADDGDYQCVVSNDLGETFSDLAKVAVHGK